MKLSSMTFGVGLLVSLTLLLVDAGRLDARPVQIDVRSTEGASLGRLVGDHDDRVTYVALSDVAGLVHAKVRPSARGDRAAVVARGQRVEVRRDSTVAVVAGRTLELSAPVRVRRGVWLVPGDLLVRALPALLGAGVQVTVGPAPGPARPASPAVTAVNLPASPPVPPARATAPRSTPAPPAPAAVAPAPPVAPPAGSAPPAPSAAAAPSDEESQAGGKGAVKVGTLELRYRSYPAYTRVVLEGPAAFEPRLVESQGGLLVPLAGLRVTPMPRVVRAVRDGLVGTLELGQTRGTTALRVTFERPPGARKVYRLQDPFRLVLEFHRAAAVVPVAGAPAPAAIQTIVIDPGHGGHDPGATGPGGLREKDLTLDVARRLAALVQEELGVKAVLTRPRDTFVALRERTAFANRQKADLFVSIHVNAARGVTASGSETYFLSSEATDNAARAAAAFENRVIDLEAGPRTGTRDLVRSILWDLAQSEFQQESSRLAEALQDSFERALRLPTRGVKQAPFYVLGGAAMPAVLVEIGFISNPQEEERLQDEGYRDRIARALAAGLGAYKKRYDRKSGVVANR
jgi:N-acetylmuramoyl-L-alanine amidase